MSTIQNTEWGYVEWLYTHEEGSARQSMNIGIIVTLPGKRQYRHIHTDEQLLYVLDGEGICSINGETGPFCKGNFFYMEAGTLHETMNTGTTPVRELLVSNPIYYESQLPFEQFSPPGSDVPVNLYTAVEAIRPQLTETVNTPFTIFDEAGAVVLQSRIFPAFCLTKCNPVDRGKDCPCMQQAAGTEAPAVASDQFVCPYGLTVFNLPILYRSRCIGLIRGGHILFAGAGSEHPEGIYDTPRSTAIGVRRLLRQVAKNIAIFCEFDAARRDLAEKANAIEQTAHYKDELVENLRVARDTVTNLKINHHFLFNTLNSMANMALKSGADPLYAAIIDLAKMFRYTMRSHLRFVALDDELGYLENYLNLQRLRYGPALTVEYAVTAALRRIAVPFNFLQPIVENAFTHGFRDCDRQKRVRIAVKRGAGQAVISVVNNGSVIDEATRRRVIEDLKSNGEHGLSLIYAKLQSAYGPQFAFDIKSTGGEETRVVVRVPIKPFEEAIL